MLFTCRMLNWFRFAFGVRGAHDKRVMGLNGLPLPDSHKIITNFHLWAADNGINDFVR